MPVNKHRPALLRTSVMVAMFGISLVTQTVAGQVLPDTTDTFSPLEALLETVDVEDGDPAQLAEALADLHAQPLNVNTASVEALSQIPALTPSLAHAIIHFRTRHGPFETLEDLREVDAMTDEVWQATAPYLTVAALPLPTRATRHRFRQNLHFEWIQRVERRLDLGRGYRPDTTHAFYSGSPNRFYTRLRARSRRMDLNVTLDKDPGERFAWDPSTRTYGFDHVSGYLAVHGLGRLETLIAGDFVAAFGQGVALWRSTSFGKGSDPVRPLVRTGQGLVPYGSTEENRFFRGLAATVMLTPRLSVSAFASRRNLDAGIQADAFHALIVTTLSTSGLHRTPGEIAKKDAVREDVLGANIGLLLGAARIGLVGYHSRFSLPFIPGSDPYQHFLFSGDRASMVSVYADVFMGTAHAFGEMARSPNGAFGGIGGVVLQPTNQVELLVLARCYPPAFVSLHGHAFGERNGATSNETGYYAGVQVHPAAAWRVAAYIDQYRFPWVRFGTPRPSTGYEVRLLIEHRPRRWLQLSLQGRSETKESGVSSENEHGNFIDAVRPATQQSLRLQGDYRFSPRLEFRARLEAVRFMPRHASAAHGLILFQDVRWLPVHAVQVDLRLAFFDTDSYESRIYTYEHDLINTFSIPSFSGRGQRAYVLVRWTPTHRLTVQAKMASTNIEDAYSLGSGLDEVTGNKFREIRILLRWHM